jgi:hypothetical protein
MTVFWNKTCLSRYESSSDDLGRKETVNKISEERETAYVRVEGIPHLLKNSGVGATTDRQVR